MARVQIVIPDEDRVRFVHQSRREGMTLSAWLRRAANDRLTERQRSERFKSRADLEEFFRSCDALAGPEKEPNWEEHLDVINASRARGASGT